MKALRTSALLATVFLAAACVTINVYFPAAAAEKAADRIIRDVYGETPGSAPAPEPQSGTQRDGAGPTASIDLLGALLDWVVAPAHAEANISIETPAIQRIKASMKTRHRSLEPFYSSGAIGMTDKGSLTVRDLNAVKLPDRRRLQQLVAEENRDRDTLYREIARANGHPEWENDIRGTFARRWISNAPSGWWYQQGSAWKKK